jgi:hypothetical protein
VNVHEAACTIVSHCSWLSKTFSGSSATNEGAEIVIQGCSLRIMRQQRVSAMAHGHLIQHSISAQVSDRPKSPVVYMYPGLVKK